MKTMRRNRYRIMKRESGREPSQIHPRQNGRVNQKWQHKENLKYGGKENEQRIQVKTLKENRSRKR